jgi:hypothetical protein
MASSDPRVLDATVVRGTARVMEDFAGAGKFILVSEHWYWSTLYA